MEAACLLKSRRVPCRQPTRSVRFPPMAEGEFQELTFPTNGEWFSADLRQFVEAVEEVYGAFRVARTYARRRSERYERSLYPELDLLEDEFYRRRKPLPPSEARRVRSLLDYLRRFPDAATVGEYYGWVTTNIDLLDEQGRLRLARARMASPGDISFEGSGEVVEQVREFVKDVSGRNRQERDMAEVAIERERVRLRRDKLDLAREYLSTFGVVPSDVLDDLGIRALYGTGTLIELEREGKHELGRGGDASNEG